METNQEKNKIDLLCDYLQKNAALAYPIKNSELGNEEDYIKNGYLKMLAMILRQGEEVQAEQLDLFKRIVAGVGVENAAEDYLRMAMDVEVEEFLTFTSECKERNLKYRWVLDAMLLSNVAEKTEKQMELLAHFCVAYAVTNDELKYVASIAKAILQLNAAEYFMAEEMKTVGIPGSVSRDYLSILRQEPMYQSENMVSSCATLDTRENIKAFHEFMQMEEPVVKLQGVSLELNGKELLFRSKEKVILEECVFTGGEGNESSIFFLSCKQVIIRKCRFQNFNAGAIYLDNSYIADAEIKVEDCEFQSCMKTYLYSAVGYAESSGAVIEAAVPRLVKSAQVTNSSFQKCISIVDWYPESSMSTVMNMDCKVYGCKFIDCGGKRTVGMDKTVFWGSLFSKGSYAVDCTFHNSSKFN